MTTVNQDICIEQGTDWAESFTIEGGAPNLSGASAAMQIRTKNGATFVASLTPQNGGLIINPSTNTITAILNNAQTTILVPDDYVYDIKVTDTAGLRYRVYQGNANISEQVTAIDPVAPSGIAITANGEDITANGQTLTT